MRTWAVLLTIVVILATAVGCSSAQKRNTALGAGVGTAAGALIGGSYGHPVEGAILGGAAGAALGYGLTER